MTIQSLITDFLEYMEIEKGRATLSIENYARYLRNFSDFALENKITTPDKIDAELVRNYRLNLNRKKHILAKNTQNYYLIALRSFLKYLNKRDIKSLDGSKIELAKTSERQITFLDDKELDEIISRPDLTTPQGIRDKAIMELLFSTGLRVSEIANLKITDVNLEKTEFSVKGKGGKVRVVFLDPTSKESLKKYLSTRRDKSEFLFISYGHTNKQPTVNSLPLTEKQNNNKRSTVNGLRSTGITPRSIQRMIKKYATSAGITKDVTPHVLRHSFATDLLMSGADLRAVQSLLGHSSITTTQIYTHVTDQHLQDVHQAFHGRRREPQKKSPSEDEDNE